MVAASVISITTSEWADKKLVETSDIPHYQYTFSTIRLEEILNK